MQIRRNSANFSRCNSDKLLGGIKKKIWEESWHKIMAKYANLMKFCKLLDKFSSAHLHEVHRAIVVTSVVPVYVYVYVYVRVTLSVKVFYKSISLDHVDGSS